MNFALVCADGIGDALITSIIAHNLRKIGHKVTVYSPHLKGFGSLLEEGNYLGMAKDWKDLFSYDAVILQHEDTKRAKEIKLLRKEGLNLYIIYTNYRTSKHGELKPGFDYPVDETKPMVYNICKALELLFHIRPSSQNCLPPKLPTIHRKNSNVVLLHPTSTREDKNWLKAKFLKLARKLENGGYQPVFIVAPDEQKDWPEAPTLATLQDLATTIYESGFFIGNDSGPIHIASYYSIPHIVLCQGKQMPLWSPGWYPGQIIKPPRWVPNIKKFRLREDKWQYFVTTTHVLRTFSLIVKQNHRSEKSDRSLEQKLNP